MFSGASNKVRALFKYKMVDGPHFWADKQKRGDIWLVFTNIQPTHVSDTASFKDFQETNFTDFLSN